VVSLTTKQEAVNAAKKTPSARTAREQQIVDQNQGTLEVRNTDFEAKKHERIYGNK